MNRGSLPKLGTGLLMAKVDYGQAESFHPIWRIEFWQLEWLLVEQGPFYRDVAWDRVIRKEKVIAIWLGRFWGSVDGLRVGGGISCNLVAAVSPSIA